MRQREYDLRRYQHLYETYELAWKQTALFDGLEYLPCFYCGDPYTERDHVFPISRVGDYDIDEIRSNLLIVPSCAECNRIAGNVVDPSLPDRKDRVQAILRTRHRDLLSRPNHSEEELSTLSGRLRQEITRREHKRRWLQERVSY